MNAECIIGNKRRMGATACYSHKCNAAMLAAAFAAVTLGFAN